MEQLWQIHPTIGDYFIQDMYTMETESLTRALQKSFAEDLPSPEMVESFFAAPDTTPVPSPTPSGGSEDYAPFSRTRRSLAPSGRVANRKSRATKRSTTTFITVDVSNFRQTVQQVTGGSFGRVDGSFTVAPVPCRPMNRPPTTLDSSTFPPEGPPARIPQPAAGLQLDSFGGFPTLESWKFM